jgi:hypothetical protein
MRDGSNQRLVKRYECGSPSVELAVLPPDGVSSRRRAKDSRRAKDKLVLARLADVSVTGCRLELLAEPQVPAGCRLELIWCEQNSGVRIAHRHLDVDSGLVVLGLEFTAMTDAFRQLLYDTITAARGVRDLDRAWDSAR